MYANISTLKYFMLTLFIFYPIKTHKSLGIYIFRGSVIFLPLNYFLPLLTSHHTMTDKTIILGIYTIAQALTCSHWDTRCSVGTGTLTLSTCMTVSVRLLYTYLSLYTVWYRSTTTVSPFSLTLSMMELWVESCTVSVATLTTSR